MKRIMLVALLVVASSAFAAKPVKVAMAPSADEALAAASVKMIDAAKDVIQGGLNDPDSAKFRHVFISPKGRAVCGEVNAKNKMGGYVGFKRFIVARDQTGMEDDDTYFAETHWQERCVDDVLFSERTTQYH